MTRLLSRPALSVWQRRYRNRKTQQNFQPVICVWRDSAKRFSTFRFFLNQNLHLLIFSKFSKYLVLQTYICKTFLTSLLFQLPAPHQMLSWRGCMRGHQKIALNFVLAIQYFLTINFSVWLPHMLKLHKHEIFWYFLRPKSKPCRPVGITQINFDSFFDFGPNFDFRKFPHWLSIRKVFTWELAKQFFAWKVMLVLLNWFLSMTGFSKFRLFPKWKIVILLSFVSSLQICLPASGLINAKTSLKQEI